MFLQAVGDYLIKSRGWDFAHQSINFLNLKFQLSKIVEIVISGTNARPPPILPKNRLMMKLRDLLGDLGVIDGTEKDLGGG